MSRLLPLAIAACLASGAAAAQDLEGAVYIDFGDEHTAVMPGFSQVSPFSSADPRVTWESAPRSSKSELWSDPLVDDGVTDGTLHLQLPPGTYAVAALMDTGSWRLKPKGGQRAGLRIGEAEHAVTQFPEGADFFASEHYAANPRPVFTPDGSVFDRQVRPTLRWRTSTIQVPKGGVSIATFGASISSLILAPTDLATLEVDLALIDAKRRDWSLAHKPDTPTDALPWATDQPPRLEVVAWDRLPDPTRARAEATDSLAVSPGQRVSLLVAVHGSDAPATATLTGGGALDVQLHEVTWLDVVERRMRRVRPHVLRPTDGPIEGGQGLAPLVALTFRVPDDAPPGPRPMQLTVARGDERATLDLDLRIRALHLAPPVAALGVWADVRSVPASIHGPDDPATQAVWENDVAVLRDHDVDLLSLRGMFYPGSSSMLKTGVPRERLARAVQAWRDAGGGRVNWVDPLFTIMAADDMSQPDSALSEAGQELMREAFAVAAELDVDVYVHDEEVMRHGPGYLAHFETLLDQLNALNEEHGAGLTGATSHAAGWPIAASRLDVVYLNRDPTLHPRLYDFFDGSRAEPWAYNLSFKREASAIMGWVLGTEAVVIWHYNEPWNDPFNDARARAHWQFAILAPDGASIWPTRRLEDLSLGVQDQRVISTTAGLIDEVGHKKRLAPQVEQACQLLTAAGSSVVNRRPEDHDDLGLFDDTALQQLQQALGDLAEALARKSPTQRALRKGRAVELEATRWPARCGAPPWSEAAQRP